MALEVPCGSDFSCKLMCGAGPGDLEGSRGSVSVEIFWKIGPRISSQTAFRHPGKSVAAIDTADFLPVASYAGAPDRPLRGRFVC